MLSVENVRFSVVVPVYNAERYLEECISSVLNQTCKNYELILVDDGSTDSSGKICDQFACEKIFVLHEENRGHTTARKNGARIAHGQYIVFLDSDDTIDMDYLEKMERSLGETNADMLVCGMLTFEDDHEHITNLKMPLCDGVYIEEDVKKYVYPTMMMDNRGRTFPRSLCAKAIKKEIILRHIEKVPRQIKTGEDMCCIISVLFDVKSLVVISDTSYHYRAVANSTSRSGDKEALFRLRFTLSFLKELADGDEELISQYRRLAVQQCYSACLRVLRTESLEYLKKAYKRFEGQTDINESIKAAQFSDKTMNLKKFILRYKMFWLIKLIDRYGL